MRICIHLFLYSSAILATDIYTSVFQRNRVADYLQHPPFLCNNISRLIFISVSSAISVADGCVVWQMIYNNKTLTNNDLSPCDRNCRNLAQLLEKKGKIRLDEQPNASRETLQRAKAHSWIRQGVFIKTSRTFSKSSSSFWKSPVKCLRNYFQAWIESFHSIFFRKRFHLCLPVCLLIERNIRVPCLKCRRILIIFICIDTAKLLFTK